MLTQRFILLVHAGRLGSNTWPVVRDLVDGVVPVTEQEIVNAMQLCYERMKVRLQGTNTAIPPISPKPSALYLLMRCGIEAHTCRQLLVAMQVVVEPSGAVGLAAALSKKFPLAPGAKVGIILCGGNVDLAGKGLWTSFGGEP